MTTALDALFLHIRHNLFRIPALTAKLGWTSWMKIDKIRQAWDMRSRSTRRDCLSHLRDLELWFHEEAIFLFLETIACLTQMQWFLHLMRLINPFYLNADIEFQVPRDSRKFFNEHCRRSAYQRDFRTDQLLSHFVDVNCPLISTCMPQTSSNSVYARSDDAALVM